MKRLPATIFCLVLLCTSGCARFFFGKRDALLPTSTPRVQDTLSLDSLAAAIKEQRTYLQSKPNSYMIFGERSIKRGKYLQALDALAQQIDNSKDPTEVLNYIRRTFDFYAVYGGDRQGQVLLTSYFEPVIFGSKTKTAKFTQPLYRTPTDLVTVLLSKFADRFKSENDLKGRLEDRNITPYLTRREIDTDGALAGLGLELCWVDPVDAFFLHIQGSGTVLLPDGKEIHAVFAEKNGRKYEAIGKFIKPLLPNGLVTTQIIEDFLRAATPEDRQELMNKNPSYVFFSESKKRAVTAIGIPATSGRTIAADAKFFPKGALVYLDFASPEPGETKKRLRSRFVLDQDSGGAITGTDHIDLFWGRGDEAKKYAGIIQERAMAYYLIPKETEQEDN